MARLESGRLPRRADRWGAEGRAGTLRRERARGMAAGRGRWEREIGAAESPFLPLAPPRRCEQPGTKDRLEHNSLYLKERNMPLGKRGGRKDGGEGREGRGRRVWKRSEKSSEPEPFASGEGGRLTGGPGRMQAGSSRP